jgi:hypothetical protein
MLRAAKGALAEGRTVAFAHLPRPWAPGLVKSPIAAEALAFALEHGVEFVDRSAVTVDAVVVQDLEIEAALRVEHPEGLDAPIEVLDKRPVRAPAPLRARRARKQPGAKTLAVLLAAAVCVAVLGSLDLARPLGAAVLAGALIFAGGTAVLMVQTMSSQLHRRF